MPARALATPGAGLWAVAEAGVVDADDGRCTTEQQGTPPKGKTFSYPNKRR
jgi:hypothetical protein